MSEDTKLKELIINTLSPEQMPEVLSDTEIYLVEDDAEYATVEELATKQDVINDLTTIRSNASTGAGLAPQVAVNTQRIEDLTTAKFPNVVIIGTPHIEGGQVSNYSDTSYLQFPFVDISRGQPFDIYFSFTTANDITTQQNILDSYFGIALAIQNGKGIMALSSNGQTWDIGMATGTNTLLPNTTYYVKYSWTGTAYSASLSLNDETYVPDMNLTSSLSPHKTTIFIGGSPNLFGPSSAHPFKGTINFNKSKVVVNNITVWEGMADVGLASRANVSLNNLDELGEAKLNELKELFYCEYGVTTFEQITQVINNGKLPVVKINRDIYVYCYSTGNSLYFSKNFAQNSYYVVCLSIGVWTTAYNALELSTNKTTSITSSSNNDQYPSAKAVYDNLITKQDTLVSGTNIKTINGESVLGSGDLEIKSGSAGLEVCDIATALYVDETKGLRRYLNGSTVAINSNTQGFLDRLKEIRTLNPEYFTDEATWQSEATMNVDGCVYKFVIDETAGIIRLPKYPEYVEVTANSIPVAGNGITLGLTDGTNLTGLTQSQNPYALFRSNGYGSNIGDSTNPTYPTVNKSLGVTTDSTKSGIETTGGITKLKLRYFIQIATGQETKVDIINEIELNNPYSFGDCKYTEIELNNLSWLRSNGQWNSKAVYVDYYNWILANANGNVDKFKKSDDEYTDYDWIVDTANETFRLPIKTNLASGKAVVGNGMTLGVTNGTSLGGLNNVTSSSAITAYPDSLGQPVGSSRGGSAFSTNASIGVITDPTKSGIETDSTGLYLYYYVGETVQNANLIDIGRIQEQLTKFDEWVYWQDGTEGYRYNKRNGYCEQWGSLSSTTDVNDTTVTFIKKFKDNKYRVDRTNEWFLSYNANYVYTNTVWNKTETQFHTSVSKNGPTSWKACGYLAEGEY